MNLSAKTSLLIFPAILFASSCSQENTFAPPPPAEVDVQPPIIRDTQVFLEFPGRTQAVSRVEIRARVKGFLKSRDFQPGQFVKKDAPLFTIEPDQFEAAVRSAEGNLAKAKADEALAQTNYDKRAEALKTKAVSEIDVLSAEAELKAATAAVEIANAALKDAERDLSYTKITSPIAGRVSKDEVDIGNLVGAADPTLLTTVVLDQPIYVNFEINERAILPHLKKRPSQERPMSIEDIGKEEKQLRIILSDGTELEEKGTLDFLDNTVDSATGTMKARGKFDNEDSSLASGIFVRIGIPQTLKDAVLVPRAAVQRDLGGDYVLVVGADDMVERRLVTPTAFTEGEFRILEPFNETSSRGVTLDDRIVVSNLQRARAGIKVTPKAKSAEADSAATKPSDSKPTEPDSPEPPKTPAVPASKGNN